MSIFAYSVEAWIVGRAGASTDDEHLIAMSTVVRGVCEVHKERSGATTRHYKFYHPFIVVTQRAARQVLMTQIDPSNGARTIVARESVENVGIAPDDSPYVGAILEWVGTKAGVRSPDPSIEDALQRGREAFE